MYLRIGFPHERTCGRKTTIEEELKGLLKEFYPEVESALSWLLFLLSSEYGVYQERPIIGPNIQYFDGYFFIHLISSYNFFNSTAKKRSIPYWVLLTLMQPCLSICSHYSVSSIIPPTASSDWLHSAWVSANQQGKTHRWRQEHFCRVQKSAESRQKFQR